MSDERIIELFWQRNEEAIALSQETYGSECFALSERILNCTEDAEECVNDTWLRAWNAIPPTRPLYLRAFFMKIVRNLSLNKLEKRSAAKRGNSQTEVLLSELMEAIPDSEQTEDIVMAKELSNTISIFLMKAPQRETSIFLRRYFYMQDIREIAEAVNLTEAIVAVKLSRMRKRLLLYLKEEYAL